MARNSEKAMTTLARWRAAHLDNKKIERRPYLASECDDLTECLKWRRQIIGEISRKVAQIQNAGLGEFKLRDLNDEINKLIREKRHWEDRIIELGGPNLKRSGPRMLDAQGREVPGSRGYKYFGATKDLPGVRELFEQAAPPPPRKTRAELMKDIDADYYGYRDEDDALIVPLEAEEEKKEIAAKVAEWKERKDAGLSTAPAEDENIYKVVEHDSDDEADITMVAPGDAEPEPAAQFIAHVPVPSQREVEEALLQRKKMELLQKYASDDLQTDSEETKKLLGIKPE